MAEAATYRFRHGYDLPRYIEERQRVAENLQMRSDALANQARAVQLEIVSLQAALEEVPAAARGERPGD